MENRRELDRSTLAIGRPSGVAEHRVYTTSVARIYLDKLINELAKGKAMEKV